MEEEGIWKLQRKFIKDKQTNTVTIFMVWVVRSLLFFHCLLCCSLFPTCREHNYQAGQCTGLTAVAENKRLYFDNLSAEN